MNKKTKEFLISALLCMAIPPLGILGTRNKPARKSWQNSNNEEELYKIVRDYHSRNYG